MTFINVTHESAQDDAYHAMPGWSVNQWKKLPHDPESFYGYHVAEPRTWILEPTPAMELGTNIHSVLLERKPFSCPPMDVLSKSGSRAGGAWNQYKDSHSSLECLSQKEAKILGDIVKQARIDPKVSWLLDWPGEVEYSLFGTDAETGLPIRGRLDKWIEYEGSRFIVDVKTISADPTNERLVAQQCLSFGYHQQAAAYLDLMRGHGKPCDAFFFLFVKTSPPHTSCIWVLNDNDIELGQRRNRIALLDLDRRLESGQWTGPRHGEVSYLTFPKYAYDDNTHIDEPGIFEEFAAYSN